PEIASALLAVVDAVRQMLQAVEATEQDGDGDFSVLIQTLEQLRSGANSAPTVPPKTILSEENKLPAPTLPQQVLQVRRAETPPPPKLAATIVAAEPSVSEAPEARASAVSDSSIRVDVGLLDKLMNLVGELVLARNQIVQHTTSQEDSILLGTVQRLN